MSKEAKKKKKSDLQWTYGFNQPAPTTTECAATYK